MKSLSIKSERGASLIEVLVVMVVLVVGIFTVIRVFPTGFSILQFTGNATVAHRLAQAEVEFWRNNTENLPEAIVPLQPGTSGVPVVDNLGLAARPNDFVTGTGAFGDQPGARDNVLTSLNRAGVVATDHEAERWVGPNRSRRVLGEVVDIPAPSPVNWGADRSASIYSLAYAPIEWSPRTGAIDPNESERYLSIRGNPRSRVDMTGMTKDQLNAAVSNLRPRQYGIDYEMGVVYFPRSDQPRQFVASYSFTTRNPLESGTVHSDRLIVPATPPSSTLPGSMVKLRVQVGGSDVFDSRYKSIIPGSDTISPKFRYLMPGQPFSTDPYEYKVLSSFPLGVQFSGAIAFNPRGFNQRESGVGGVMEPLKARIDYTVKDWRILHQDVTLPARPPYRARLALQFLKRAGETLGEADLAPWPGLMGDPRQLISVVAVDLADGSIAVNDPTSAGTPAQGSFAVDYRNGTLIFPPGASAGGQGMNVYTPFGQVTKEDPAGRTYRIFYSAEGEWAVVPQKAYAEYQVQTGDAVTVNLGNAVVVPRVLNDNGRQAVQVVFPVPDEGKAVSYNVTYRTRDGNLKTIYGRESQITSEVRQAGLEPWYYMANPANPIEAPKPYLKIQLPPDARVNDFSNDFVLSQVRGTSFRAVTVWRDRSRWRQQAITTHLMRKG